MSATANSLKVATDLAWGIVHEQSTQEPHKVQEVVDMVNVMYPGINYWHSQLRTVAVQVAKPDILKAYPLLATFMTEAEALEELGDAIEIVEVKACNGYEWQGWKPN